MLVEIDFNPYRFDICASVLFKKWSKNKNKVFVLRAKSNIKDVRNTYENFFDVIGSPLELGEDVRLGDRSGQRNGSIWFEVRNDKNFKDAYRHSQNAQPLHTDGSYIPDYPTTIMACERNEVEGGETTFIDSDDIYDVLQHENINLLKSLEKLNIKHERSGDSRIEKILKKDENSNSILVNWNYYCLSKNLNSNEKFIADQFQSFLINSREIKRRTINVSLQRGDSVLWKDSYCLHGRNSFVAKNDSDRFLLKCAIQINKN